MTSASTPNLVASDLYTLSDVVYALKELYGDDLNYSLQSHGLTQTVTYWSSTTLSWHELSLNLKTGVLMHSELSMSG